jgi:hypothetical protein
MMADDDQTSPGRKSLAERWADDDEPVTVLKPPTGTAEADADNSEDPDDLDVNLFAP